MFSLLKISTFEAMKFSKKYLINIPNKTGSVTTKNIFSTMPVIEMFWVIFVTPNKLAEIKIIKGAVIIQIKLITAVSETDNETSPFATFLKSSIDR